MKKYYYRLKNRSIVKGCMEALVGRKRSLIDTVRSISCGFTNHVASNRFLVYCSQIIDDRYYAFEDVILFDADRKILNDEYVARKCELANRYNDSFRAELNTLVNYRKDFASKDVIGNTTKPSHWVNNDGVMDSDDVFVNVHEIHCFVQESDTGDSVIKVTCWDDIDLFCIKDMYIRDNFLYIVTHDDDIISYIADKVRLSEPSIIDKVDYVAGENINLAKVQAHRKAIIAEIKKGNTEMLID